uniref:Uncharacterized protein n=1 Tax=Arundo donax TaxID=35708 RepID=A0A0A8ZSS8_ARUDO
MKVFSYIEMKYKIEVRDVSFRKILVLIGKTTVVLHELEDSLRLLGKLHECCSRESNRHLLHITE